MKVYTAELTTPGLGPRHVTGIAVADMENVRQIGWRTSSWTCGHAHRSREAALRCGRAQAHTGCTGRDDTVCWTT